jgi:serine/threonine protein kinase
MHLQLKVAHRDIKPENIVVAESSPTHLHLQICDFDLASHVPRSGQCQNFCGTFPFLAPEMLRPPYHPFPVDIWSLGVVFLEVACGCNVVTRAVIGDMKPTNDRERMIMTDMIGEYLQTSGNFSNILEEYTRPELRAYMQEPDTEVAQILQGMLSVPVHARLTAQKLRPQS